jgi:hypothetical protein
VTDKLCAEKHALIKFGDIFLIQFYLFSKQYLQ